MSAPVIAFFSSAGRVGRTSLVYHLAWMYADLGASVVAADVDPQANLTAAFLDDDRLEQLWTGEGSGDTIFDCVNPLLRGVGDISVPELEPIEEGLTLLVGHLSLSSFEDELSSVWPKCGDGEERAFRVTSAFWRIMQRMAHTHHADVILMDLGPNLGAINRAALVSADHIVIPLSPDLFSLQGLRNLGPTLKRWRIQWKERLEKNPAANLSLPQGATSPMGYIVMQHSVRLDRPVQAYERWIARIPTEYRNAVLELPGPETRTVAEDPNCLALLRHYRSLMPLAQEARKPMFRLRSADGAIGAHGRAVQGAYRDFRSLAREIAKRAAISLP